MMAEGIINGLAIREKALGYTSALTFAEFLERAPAVHPLLRIRRQEVRLTPDAQQFFALYPQTLHFLVIASEDSPETTAVLPILVKIAEAGLRFDLRILLEDDHQSALSLLIDEPELLNGVAEADFPLLLIFDEEWQYQEQWGPHPQAAEDYLDDWLARYPEYETAAEDDSPQGQETSARLLERLTQEMRIWYNSALGDACVHEVRELIAGLLDESEGDERG
jgi:hypothetical protein